ncbi:predicted protein [Uncinocarpus reesii 1704]|uniref:Uncharacterized protein n=1 Tax=Uncinocarpus reesii (strain UAMH 1704) TaxID=336963 RepID=C4JP89_UNCRE|nr:uncharacterized protein UREG_04471 [Uncinocarpus reesii 1704]EEP79625.1 predicted protein [Uncinocarpus reesii 1704]
MAPTLSDRIRQDDESGKNALHYAVHGNPKTVQFLLEHQIDPDAMDKNGMTPLYYAVNGLKVPQPGDRRVTSYIQIIKLLIDAGADPWLPCRGRTPLVDALLCEEPIRIVTLMLPELLVVRHNIQGHSRTMIESVIETCI